MHRISKWMCFIAFAVAVRAYGQTLSLPEAQRRAAELSRQLAAQDSAVLALREMAVAAGQLPDPVLKLGIDNLPVNGEDRFSLTRDFMTMRRIGVMQELTRGQKREARAQRFEREAEKSLADKDATLAGIQRETALAWLERYYTEAMAGALAYFHVALSAKVLSVLLLLELVAIFWFDAAVFIHGGREGISLQPFAWSAFQSGNLGIAMIFALALFVGFEATAIYREETRDQTENGPVAAEPGRS